eukprot:m.311560 g.311560  ORF g.311560 m.311560 type:complete len:195 (+) comp81230_c0_seq1:58-642(+)
MDAFSVILTFGNKKQIVELQDGPSSLVQTLAERATDLYGVPIGKQKLLNRGKSLHPFEKSLADFGVSNGSKVMVIGRPYVIENDVKYKEMVSIGEKAEKTVDRIDEIEGEVDGVRRGFLPAQLHSSALERLRKRCLTCTEELMCCLEKLDGIRVEGEASELREFRKREVCRIQKMIDSVDVVQQEIATLKNKTS